MEKWGGGELGAPTTDREWGLGAMGRWGVWIGKMINILIIVPGSPFPILENSPL
jgi:hypothetical protein